MKALEACLLALVTGLLACAPAPEADPPDVLLITVDTLRADYVHAYGFAEENTPTMDALAARGVLFENAIAAATLTAPAHASIMTSRYVREHSIGSRNGDTRLEGLPTLAQRFAEAGYATGAFVSNVVLRRRIGLDRGFHVYDDELPSSERNRDFHFERQAGATAGRALEWLMTRPGSQPVFLWLHLQDPHGPYTPPGEWSGTIAPVPLAMKGELGVLPGNSGRAGIPAYQALGEARDPALYAARYAEEIRYADHWAGRVIEALEARSAKRGAVILLTADHGESLGEGGWFFQHGQSTAPELARVPFIVVAPGLAPGRVRGPVSHVDVAPTLLALARLPELPGASGYALSGQGGDEQFPRDRLIFCDTDGESAAYGAESWTRIAGAAASDRPEGSAIPTRSETVRRNAAGKWRPADPDTRAMGALGDYLARRASLVAAGPMAPEHVEELRALGYLPPHEADASEDANQASPAASPISDSAP